MIEVKFSLELTKNGVQKSIHAKAGEQNSRKAVITLTENGKVFNAEGYRVRVAFEDGTHSGDLEVINGCIEFVLPDGLIDTEGEKLCELRISTDRSVLYSPVFRIIVEGSLGEKSNNVPVGSVTQYQEVISCLPVGNSISADDEIAVYTPDDELTTKRKVSSLPFGKKLENEEQLEKINASDVDSLKRLSEGKYAETENIPTKVSQLTNDKGFVTEAKINSMIDEALEGAGGLTEQQASALDANTKARHTHDNKSVLDKFSINSNSELLFGGKPVSSQSGSGVTVEPELIAAQVVTCLMSNIELSGGGISYACFDSVEIVSDQFLGLSPIEWGGNVMIYAPPDTGSVNIAYWDKTFAFSKGSIYVCYVTLDEEYNNVNHIDVKFGTYIREFFINGLNL